MCIFIDQFFYIKFNLIDAYGMHANIHWTLLWIIRRKIKPFLEWNMLSFAKCVYIFYN